MKLLLLIKLSIIKVDDYGTVKLKTENEKTKTCKVNKKTSQKL